MRVIGTIPVPSRVTASELVGAMPWYDRLTFYLAAAGSNDADRTRLLRGFEAHAQHAANAAEHALYPCPYCDRKQAPAGRTTSTCAGCGAPLVWTRTKFLAGAG